MHPFVELLGWQVGGYRLLLSLGLALCVAVAVLVAPRFGVPRRVVLALGAVCSVAGYFGAWAYSGLVEVGYHAWQHGHGRAGLSIHGGLIAGAAAGALVARLFRVPFPRFADLAATVLPLGLAFGRSGCLLAGCCYGKPTSFVWALVYDDFAAAARPIGVPLHATPIYLALGNALLFAVVLWWRLGKRRFAGQLALEVLAAVSLLRFTVEFLRADNRGPILLAGLPWAQWVALLIAGSASAARVIVWRGTAPSTAKLAEATARADARNPRSRLTSWSAHDPAGPRACCGGSPPSSAPVGGRPCGRR